MEVLSYGNVSWRVYVYGSYFLVLFGILIYEFWAIRSRNKALDHLEKEGFLEDGQVDGVE